MPRAIASATVSFGLVTIPVEIYPAVEPRADIHFHWVHAKCGTRLQQQYYCPKDDEVVDRKDMVKGYELSKGKYVTFTPKELKALEQQATQTIEVTEFLPIDKVDPIYFERPYHVGPGKGGQHAFALFGQVLAESERAAIARYAARGKQYLVLLRPFEHSLVMHQLHYDEEIRKPIASFAGKVNEAERKLARQLVDQITADRFRPEQYEDDVRSRVLAQIKKKARGREIEAPEAKPEKGKVVDLMEALKASLGQKGARRAGERRPAKTSRRHASSTRRRGGKRTSAA